MMRNKIIWLVMSGIIALSLEAAACGPASNSNINATSAASTTPVTSVTPTSTPTPTSSSRPVKPAAFSTSNLTVSPSEVAAGAPISIQFTVTNLGEEPGTTNVTLKIDGDTADTKTLSLAAGARQDVSFTEYKFTSKTYSIAVDNLSGTFTVKPYPTPTKPAPVATTNAATAASTNPTASTAIDVSWKELRSFLLSSNASAPLRSSAKASGIRVGTASLRFSTRSYTLNAFSTTDYGLVYVDDQKAAGSFLVWSIDVSSYFCLAVPLSQLDITHLHDQKWWSSLTSVYGAQITSPTGEKLWDSPTQVTVTW